MPAAPKSFLMTFKVKRFLGLLFSFLSSSLSTRLIYDQSSKCSWLALLESHCWQDLGQWVSPRFKDIQVAGFKELQVHYWSRFGSVISRFISRLQHGQLMWPQWHWNTKLIQIHIFMLNNSFLFNVIKCVRYSGLYDHVDS